MKKVKLNISIYDYNNYREFLEDAYKDLHEQEPRFSYRFLQKKAGYSANSNHFWQIITGRVPLSQQAAQRFARALNLNARETQFLTTLAGMNQARTDADRNQYMEQLKQFSAYKKRKNAGQLRYEYYSEWFLPPLRELVNLQNFREDADWIANKLVPHITPRQARDGIKKLLDLGFLTRDERGYLKQTEPMIGSTRDRRDVDPVQVLAVRNFHRFMIKMGMESIENIPQKHRFVVGTTMSVSYNQREEIRNLTQEFMDQVEKIIVRDEPVETVCRLNVQLFPLVTVNDEALKAIEKSDD